MYRYPKILLFSIFIFFISCTGADIDQQKHRVIISTDIGGTDPDDNQSLIHLMMYSDKVQIEGIISSPYGKGRKQEILRMIDIYEKDFHHLEKHQPNLIAPNQLREVSKQGVIASAPFKGFSTPTEGSKWIAACAEKPSDKPLWILVWGGLEDVAQALHDSPEIASRIRVFWIGGPNKKWSTNAYDYIASNHPDLWFIESNATYRGWFMEEQITDSLISQENYYSNYIHGHGHMGEDFKNYYDGQVKMGDTPSLGYLLHGDPNDPSKPSWGGQHRAISYSSKHIFEGGSSLNDTVPTYGVVEWRFKGPEQEIAIDSVCFWMDIQGDSWPGYYVEKGTYAVRYSPKQKGNYSYSTRSKITALNGLRGDIVSTTPWPASPNEDDYLLGDNWYGDLLETEYFLNGQQGAKTLSRHRAAYLADWAHRWQWLD